MSKTLILGLGVSGKSCTAFLLKQKMSVIAVDRNWEKLLFDPQVQMWMKQGLELFSDTADLNFSSIVQAIVSPGIHPDHPLIQKCKHLGIPVRGEIEFALSHLDNRCVGITGTNGKTTTTLLITHILNQAGIAARALGNVGASLSGYLMEPNPKEILLIELSSFQLETLQIRKLDAALILNLTPNHLDRHLSMEAYAKAKLQIQHCLKESAPLYVSHQLALEYGKHLKQFEVFDAPSRVAEMQNVKAARAICSLFGVSDFDRKQESFKKPLHRMEWVAEINEVAYYNDSKATSVDAVIYGVSQLAPPLILVAGGVDKGASYRPWMDSFCRKVKKIVVFGQAAKKIEQELKSAFSIERVQVLEEAFAVASKMAVKKDTILFSPGCSSFDQFLNYEARGEEFKRMVRELEWKEKKPF